MREYTKWELGSVMFLIALLTLSMYFSFTPYIGQMMAANTPQMTQSTSVSTSPIMNDRPSIRNFEYSSRAGEDRLDWSSNFKSTSWSVERPERTVYDFNPVALSPGTPHTPIVITSNGDFESQGWLGNGTLSNPYLIDDLEINATALNPGISISNTDVYFEISNCAINGSSQKSNGIVLYSVTNGRVFNNTIFDGSIGILLNETYQSTVIENVVDDMGRAGIYLDQCQYTNWIDANNCTNSWDGIYLERSNDAIITDNLCVGNQWGIGLYWNSDNNHIFRNRLDSNIDHGIMLAQDCTQTEIVENTCVWNNGSGIYIEYSDSNTISNNTCQLNRIGEIYATSSNYNNISYNFVYFSNGETGLALERSNYTHIQYNDLFFVTVSTWMINCTNNVFLDNNCTTYMAGLALEESHSNNISRNVFDGDEGEIGVVCIESNSNSISYCNFTDNADGIVMAYGSNYTEVSYNNFTKNQQAIYVLLSRNCVIYNNFCELFQVGIGVENSNGTSIRSNDCWFGESGIHILNSSNVDVLDNTCVHNTGGTSEGNIAIENSPYCTVSGNNCTGMEGSSDFIVHIYFLNSPYGNVTYNTGSFGIDGIHLENSHHVNATDNEIWSTQGYGVGTFGSNSCLISRNTITNHSGWEGWGIPASGCYFNVYSHNNIANTTSALFFEETFESTIEYNVLENSTIGLELLDDVNGTVITQNTFFNNSRGIVTHRANVSIIWNTFLKNNESAWVEFNVTQTVFEYNFWSDYTGSDANSDGIGDTLYTTDGLNPSQDMHPLMYIPTPYAWIVEPSDQFLEYGHSLSYQVSVHIPAFYAPLDRWWISDTDYFSISTEGVISDDMTLNLGEYDLEVRAYNFYGFYTSGFFTVTVNDTIAPTTTSPADITYVEGTTGNVIDWTATDLGPVSYSITLDGAEIASGAWNTSGEVISISCDGLSVGTYIYVLTVTDVGGNTFSDSVTVIVTAPIDFIDPTMLIIAAAGAVIVIIIIIYMMRKRSGAK